MQFFISHLASWLRTRRFSDPTFRPSGAPNHWKNTVFRDFPTFLRICIFFLLTLLSSNLSLLSASSLLCFSSVHIVHIVGSLTSKLPSTTYIYIYTYSYHIFTFALLLCIPSGQGTVPCGVAGSDAGSEWLISIPSPYLPWLLKGRNEIEGYCRRLGFRNDRKDLHLGRG